jgi:hypothetical protein
MTVVTVWYWDLSSDNDKYDIDFSLWEDEIFSGKQTDTAKMCGWTSFTCDVYWMHATILWWMLIVKYLILVLSIFSTDKTNDQDEMETSLKMGLKRTYS